MFFVAVPSAATNSPWLADESTECCFPYSTEDLAIVSFGAAARGRRLVPVVQPAALIGQMVRPARRFALSGYTADQRS